MPASNLTSKLERAIALSRQAGLTATVDELEGSANGVYTTSSEYLGEVGEAIQKFQAREGKRIPPEAAELLDDCLRDIGVLWPKYIPGWVAKAVYFLARLAGKCGIR